MSQTQYTQKEIVTTIQAAEEFIRSINPRLYGAKETLEFIEDGIFNEFINQWSIEIGWLARCEVYSIAKAIAHKQTDITSANIQASKSTEPNPLTETTEYITNNARVTVELTRKEGQ